MSTIHDAGCEVTLIGAAVLDPSAVLTMRPLPPEAFFVDAHAAIWRGITALAGKEWTVSSLKASMGAACTPEVRGALSNAEANVYSAGGLDELADRLRDLAVRREAWWLAKRINSALDAGVDTQTLVAMVGNAGLGRGTAPSSLATSQDVLDDALTLLQACQDGSAGEGVPFGLPELDRMTTGMRPGEVWLIASRPGIGKSALAAQSLLAAASRGVRSLLVSLEMTRAEVGVRALCSEARVDQRKARTPHSLDDYSLTKLNAQMLRISALPFHVDDGFAAGVAEIRSIAHGIKAQHDDLGFVIVDYLQLMGGDRNRSGNREQEIAGISRGLKMLAKELNLPVLALSQLSRDMEKGKRVPQLSDLRESGSLEQDASGVIFLYRDAEAVATDGVFIQRVIVAKQRNGPLGSFDVAFEAKYTRFTDCARGREE